MYAHVCLFHWPKISFSVVDFRNMRTFNRKQSFINRTAVFEKLIMLDLISDEDLCKFKSSDDSIAGPKHVI